MPDGKLIERRLDGQTLVQGNFLKVCRDRVELPDGTVTTREYVVHPGAVMIVPLLDDGAGHVRLAKPSSTSTNSSEIQRTRSSSAPCLAFLVR